MPPVRKRNLVGQTFNHLRMLRLLGRTVWECECLLCTENGRPVANHREVATRALESGSAKACLPCQRLMGAVTSRGRGPDLDFVGATQPDGRLTIEQYIKHGFWRARCTCGNTRQVTASQFKREQVKACRACASADRKRPRKM